MTYLEAMQAARDGHYVREKEMSPGWKIAYARPTKNFFCINPHTGGDYQYIASDKEKRSYNWSKTS